MVRLSRVANQPLFKFIEKKYFNEQDGKICNPYQLAISNRIKQMIEDEEINIQIDDLLELEPSDINERIGINNPYGGDKDYYWVHFDDNKMKSMAR